MLNQLKGQKAMINKQEFLETYNYIDNEVLVEIIDIFLNEYEQRIDKLYIDVNTGDYKALRYDAHAIKGVIANFFAKPAWEIAKKLEDTGAGLIEDISGAEEHKLTEMVNTLSEYVQTMASQLKEIKEELISPAG
jgi:HPt (histidine-containing phosphotransfer) domain-containing protein